MKPLKQLLQKQPTSLCYYKERYKSTIIHTTNKNIQWTTHPKKKTIIVVPIKASMLLITITHNKKHHYLLVTLCDIAAVIIIVLQQSSLQQMQSYHSATNIIATNVLNWYRTHHTTASQQTRPFL